MVDSLRTKSCQNQGISEKRAVTNSFMDPKSLKNFCADVAKFAITRTSINQAASKLPSDLERRMSAVIYEQFLTPHFNTYQQGSKEFYDSIRVSHNSLEKLDNYDKSIKNAKDE